MASAQSISDAGDILGEGQLPDGNTHNFLLIPNIH
jgi:hypothetical protein